MKLKKIMALIAVNVCSLSLVFAEAATNPDTKQNNPYDTDSSITNVFKNPNDNKSPANDSASTAAEKDIVISDAKITLPPGGSSNAALYCTIQNNSGNDYTFVSAEAPNFVNKIELHENQTDNSKVLKMKKADTLVIKAHSSVKMQAATEGADGASTQHFMLMGLKKPLSAGSEVPITIHFNNNVQKKFTAKVSS